MIAAAPALLTFRPSPPLAELQRDINRLVAVRAANGAGKTTAITRKIAKYAVDHPNTRHRMVAPTRHHAREVTGRYLWEYLEPYCHPSSRWYAGTGWNRNGVILLANRTEIELRSNLDPQNAHEGRHDLGIIGIDEVPSYSVFMANKGRAHVQLLMGFTIQDKAAPEWLRPEIEGKGTLPIDSPTEGRTVHEATGWVQYVVPLLRQNVPWMSEEEFQERTRSYVGTDEEARRLWAAWEGTDAKRKLGGWGQRLIRTRAQLIDELCGPDRRLRFDWARYGIDHGNSGVGKQCGYLIVGRGDRYYVLHEWLGSNTTTPKDAAQGLLDGLKSWGVPLQHVRAIVGDLNSAGPMGAGAKLNEVIEFHLRELAGGVGPGITAPVKTGDWKTAREAGINTAMLEGRWFVCDECPQAIRSYGNYSGHPRDPNKDSIDAQGYAVQDLVVEVPRAPAGEYRRH